MEAGVETHSPSVEILIFLFNVLVSLFFQYLCLSDPRVCPTPALGHNLLSDSDRLFGCLVKYCSAKCKTQKSTALC